MWQRAINEACTRAVSTISGEHDGRLSSDPPPLRLLNEFSGRRICHPIGLWGAVRNVNAHFPDLATTAALAHHRPMRGVGLLST